MKQYTKLLLGTGMVAGLIDSVTTRHPKSRRILLCNILSKKFRKLEGFCVSDESVRETVSTDVPFFCGCVGSDPTMTASLYVWKV